MHCYLYWKFLYDTVVLRQSGVSNDPTLRRHGTSKLVPISSSFYTKVDQNTRTLIIVTHGVN